MQRAEVTRLTSASVPLRGGPTRAVPPPSTLVRRGVYGGPLQWALEGQGWTMLRHALDLALLCTAVVLAEGGVRSVLNISSVDAPLLALPLLVMLLLHLRGMYRTRLRSLMLDSVVPLLSGVSVAAMAVEMLGLFANGRPPDQSTILRAWLFALLALGLGRAMLSYAQRSARARRLIGRPVLIMGAGVVGAQVARRLESHPEYGLAPIGFLDDDPPATAEVGGRDAPVLGRIEDLDKTVSRTGVRNLIVAFSSIADAQISQLIQHCQELGIEVSVVPRMFDTINNRVGYDTVGALPLMSFTSVDPRGLQFAFKHAFDRILAFVALVLLSPLLLCAALAVRVSSGGPVIFRQRRVGRQGEVFDLYKFRSMRTPALEAEQDGADESASEVVLAADTAPGGVEGDDRRTRVGRFLRRTSLDELPQLVNVLRGEMSIVGPRPERPEFVELFRQDVTRYGDRHRVKSGITGWAQVHGLRGQTSLAERVEWDNYYIAHWSLGLDLRILALTLIAVFRNAA